MHFDSRLISQGLLCNHFDLLLNPLPCDDAGSCPTSCGDLVETCFSDSDGIRSNSVGIRDEDHETDFHSFPGGLPDLSTDKFFLVRLNQLCIHAIVCRRAIRV